MLRKALLTLIWLGLTLYTIWLAPVDQPATWDIAGKLLTFQTSELNDYIPAIFWMMGIWPMIYAGFMFADGKMQPFRVWPYFIGSNFIGVICLLPYLILRKRNQEFDGEKDDWLKMLDHPLLGLFLLLGTVALFSWALSGGDWQDYVELFHTRAFVHLISIDFCLMGLIFPLSHLLEDDMARRGLHNQWVFWVVSLVPLFGPLFYLSLRPPLPEKTFNQPKNSSSNLSNVNQESFVKS